jgi:hypothetical protein
METKEAIFSVESRLEFVDLMPSENFFIVKRTAERDADVRASLSR